MTILSASSEGTIESHCFHFKVMLMNKNWAEHEEKRIILKETPACQNVFEVNINIGAVRIAKRMFLR